MQFFKKTFRKDWLSYSIPRETHPHYMKPLDGIRALACLIVIVSHIAPLLHLNFEKDASLYGALGVLLFFSLSGFLMSALYFDEAFTTRNAVRYIIARFSRIAPAYWIAVIFVWGIYLFLPDFIYQMTFENVGKAFLFNSNQGVFGASSPKLNFIFFFLVSGSAVGRPKKGSGFIWLYFSSLHAFGFISARSGIIWRYQQNFIYSFSGQSPRFL